MLTESASKQRTSWQTWSTVLHRYGLENFVAWALEAAGPLNVIGAQMLYFGSPLLRPAFDEGQIEAWQACWKSARKPWRSHAS
jgi:hypothetical protein